MANTLSPYCKIQFFDNDGEAAALYQLFVYLTGTTTKATTYQDSSGSSANVNPIILDSAGRAVIYLPEQTVVKYVLADPSDTDPPSSPIWTIDPVNPVPSGTYSNLDVTGTAGENLSDQDCIYISQGDGGLTAGRWYKADADFTYASNNAAAVGFAQGAATTGNSVTVRLNGKITTTGLTAGDLYYVSATAGAITNVTPANARIVGCAESTTSLVLGQFIPFADATTPGLMSTTTQTLAGDKTWTGVQEDTSSTASTFYTTPEFYPGDSQATSGTLARTMGGFGTPVTSAVGSSTGGTVDMFTVSVPANTLSSDGSVLVIRAGGSFAANGNTKVLTAIFDGTSAQVFSTAANGTYFECEASIFRYTSTTGRISTQNQSSTAGAQDSFGNSSVTTDFAVAKTFVLRASAATANNDFVLRYAYAYVVSAG